MKSKVYVVVIGALLALGLVACSGVSATVHFRSDEEYNYLTIDMTEAEVQTLFTGIFEENQDLPITNPVVDLRPGEIGISGEVASGNDGTVPVNLTVQAGMVNDQPSLTVTDISFAGWDGTPDMLESINSELANGLAEAAQNTNEGQLTEVSITDDSLSFTIRGPREE